MSTRKKPGKPRAAAAEQHKAPPAADDGERFQAVIDRIRRYAHDAIYSPIYGGIEFPPLPHDDADLMELCSTILHLHRQETEARKQMQPIYDEGGREFIRDEQKSAERRERLSVLSDEARKNNRRVATLSKQASKLAATTPEGIFAKALIVRKSRTGATVLAMSLARDLIEAPNLRAILWPR